MNNKTEDIWVGFWVGMAAGVLCGGCITLIFSKVILSFLSAGVSQMDDNKTKTSPEVGVRGTSTTKAAQEYLKLTEGDDA